MVASWGTGFSGAQKIGINPFFDQIEIGYDSEMKPVYSRIQRFESVEIKPFNNQFSDNNNRTIDFRMNIPIFNGWFTRSNISKAKLAIENARYNQETEMLRLNKTVHQAWADATASLKRYAASQKAVESYEESFKYSEQRFNLGMLTSLDYNNAKNELQRAQSEMLQAKYEYVFKTKVLDFYMGIPIAL
jgi:outer membrane protein